VVLTMEDNWNYDYDDDFTNDHEHRHLQDVYIFDSSVGKSTRTYKSDDPNVDKEDWKLDLVSRNVKESHYYTTDDIHGAGCPRRTVTTESGQLTPDVLPYRGRLDLHFKDGRLDYFYVSVPEIYLDYTYTSEHTFDQSRVCQFITPGEDYTETGKSPYRLSEFFSSRTAQTLFGSASLDAVQGIGLKVIPQTGKYYSGGKTIKVRVDVRQPVRD
jgi:hypothetical protein